MYGIPRRQSMLHACNHMPRFFPLKLNITLEIFGIRVIVSQIHCGNYKKSVVHTSSVYVPSRYTSGHTHKHVKYAAGSRVFVSGSAFHVDTARLTIAVLVRYCSIGLLNKKVIGKILSLIWLDSQKKSPKKHHTLNCGRRLRNGLNIGRDG